MIDAMMTMRGPRGMHAAGAIALFAVAGLLAGAANADVLRFTTGYPSQAATAGNPGLGSGASFIPNTSYGLTAFELTITRRTRIDRFAVVGNTPLPQLEAFHVIVHSSLASFAANPLIGDVYGSTGWNIDSEESFGAGGGAGGMAWNYYTLTNPLGSDLVLGPGSYAITIYRDTSWRFADSDVDLGTDWAAVSSFPSQLFAWQSVRPSGTAAIDVYGTVLITCPACAADYDNNGGVDGGDLAAFFTDFEQGLACADVDNNGGIDGGDLAAFFNVFEAGGCE